MDILSAIYERRAVRAFSADPVSDRDVLRLLDAAAQAPSAANLQPWAFAVFHGRARLRAMSDRVKAHLLASSEASFGMDPRIDVYADADADLFHGAHTLVVIYARPGRFHPSEECHLAAQNLMLAAMALGLGTCPIGFARSWFDRPDVKAEFNIPPHYSSIVPIAVGHAAFPPPRPVRNGAEIAGWQWD
ncbi:MAG TPA: nitroreductase family protein [Candidatus Didemnitutus sp.]|nr:nitroreductase family protein [Candidatus Didemnitutus sp.]